MGGAEHFPAGRGEDKNPRGGVGRDEGENPQKRHFCEESQSVNKVKWKDFPTLSSFKASFVGELKRGINGTCSQFCPAAPRGRWIFTLNRAEKWFNSIFNSKLNRKYSVKKLFIQYLVENIQFKISFNLKKDN